jgi:hypothetical protein
VARKHYDYYDYVGPLLKVAGRKRRRGRPAKLDPRSLLRPIAEVATKYPRSKTNGAIARWLRQRPEYQAEDRRTLERHVDDAIADTAGMLKDCPAVSWQKIFGIDPPAEMTREALRDKTLELLRRQLVKN